MRYCIVGAGAMGGLLAAKLALSGEDVTVIARGAHLQAIQRDGLKLIMKDGEEHVARDIVATSDMREAGEHDVVILGIKAQQIPGLAHAVRLMFGENTVVVPVQNGIPWWYFHKHGGPFDGRRLNALDPVGAIDGSISPERIIGCIAYPAGYIAEPGVIQHVSGDRFPLGELDGTITPRIEAISESFTNAGFKAYILEDIRSEVWLKLWGNLSFNPVSALTGATLEGICQYPPSRDLVAAMMTEAQDVAHKLGITFRHTIEKRIDGAEKVGAHKTSMLQDVEAGRPTEVEATVGAVVELGRLTETPTPHIDAIYACLKLLEETRFADSALVAA